MPARARPGRPRVRIVVAAAVAAALGGSMLVLDWKRDFTTNVAETSPDADDERLRPLVIPLARDAAVAAVEAAAASLPRWSYLGRTDGDRSVRLAFTRTTRVFRFVDDVTVRIETAGDASLVNVRSASRLGTGDLGQNPRNIAELFRAIRRQPQVSGEVSDPFR